MIGTLIYALCDPYTEEIRYVGKAKRPTDRLSMHVGNAKRGFKTHVARWIRLLPGRPLMLRLAIVPDDYASEMERRTIAHFRAKGYRLTNLTDGGEGNLGWHPSAETRARQSSSQKGRIPLVKNALGFRHGPEARARMSAAQKRKATWYTPSIEARYKMGAATRGRTISPEIRAKISATLMGHGHSSETRAKISTALMGNRNQSGRG